MHVVIQKIDRPRLIVSVSLCVSTAPLPGQQESASITGQITDSSGATIPGARVTIRNQAPAPYLTACRTQRDSTARRNCARVFTPFL